MAPHSSTLAWKIPWAEEPGRLQSMGSQRVEHGWATSLSLFTFMHWRRKWQPTPVFLTGESPWTKEPGGLHSMGWQRVWHDWVTKHSTLIELPVKEMVCLFQECAHPGCGNCASYSQAASREPETYGRWSINIELNVKINMTQMKLKDACSLEEKLWPT